MAWDTGGAAWDLGIVDGIGDTGPIATARTALRDAFFDSLGAQINRQAAADKVYHGDVPIIEVNVGGTTTAIGSYVHDAPFAQGTYPLITTTETATINPEQFTQHRYALNAHGDLLESGRQGSTTSPEMVWSFDSSNLYKGLEDGTYTVELYFAELAQQTSGGLTTANNRKFDVLIENRLLLDDYNIYNDRAAPSSVHPQTGAVNVQIVEGVPDSPETFFQGVVKRFEVEVADGNGLQVKLRDVVGEPLLNAIRILKSDRPLAVTDIILDNWNIAAWDRAPFDFAAIIQNGEQLRPIATTGINQLQIRFSEDIRKRSADGLSLTPVASTVAEGTSLITVNRTSVDNDAPVQGTVTISNFTYDPDTFVATWRFQQSLDDGKYAIHLKTGIDGQIGIADVHGRPLDADWTNDPGEITVGGQKRPTWDNFQDDPERQFITGDGNLNAQGNEFRFHFAILVGDYNGDGLVNTSDTVSITNTYSDGNGDADYNSSDTTTRNGNINDYLPLRKVGGADFFDDEIVSYQDLGVWHVSYDTNADGDASGDGETIGNDYTAWTQAYGDKSAWYIAPPEPPVGLIGTAAPQVMNVIISGSMSTHSPFSFDTVDGSGTQLNTVPVGGADTISIVFSEAVNVSAETLFVVGLRSANLPELAEFHYDPLTYTATWRFEGWALGDNYLLHLSDSITDTEGNFLDGEWTNPQSTSTTNSLVSEFPSGQGDPGGAFVFVMTLLAGDTNLDGIVDTTDLTMVLNNFYGPAGQLFATGDSTGDGLVTLQDYTNALNNFFVNLQTISILADFDADGDVDDADLFVIYNNYGSTTADWEHGDLNGDAIVDELDIDLAFAQFGLWWLDREA